MTPRMLRIKDAADYLGVSISFFRSNIKPRLKERSWLGVISFDRMEIDDFINRMNLAEDNKKPDTGIGNMRAKPKGGQKCPRKTSPASTKGEVSGTSTNNIEASEFDRAVLQIVGNKRKVS